ncbi:thyrotropin-releasing hormone receptor-like [Lineus longissimus]|uniref:thyrotropin-releasing hormone receptor-like n=1 Tax=Lineus longissimus TaxID=88925 RepID=UPI00315DBC24
MEFDSNTDANATASTSRDPPYYHALQLGYFILQHYVPVISGILGIFGNISAFLVTTKKENRRNSSCVFMSAMAVADTLFLVVKYIGRGTINMRGSLITFQERKVLTYFVWYGQSAMTTASSLFLAGMNIDRTLAILFPLKANTWCTASRARKVVIGMFLWPVLFDINILFTFKPFWLTEDTMIILLDVPHPKWLETAIATYELVAVIVPFTTIVLCNALILFGILRSAKRRSKMAGEETTGQRTMGKSLTRMLILVSVFYVIFNLPIQLYSEMVRNSSYNPDPYEQVLNRFIYKLFGELFHFNFACNYYLYIMGGGAKFRNDAKGIYMSLFRCFKNKSFVLEQQ